MSVADASTVPAIHVQPASATHSGPSNLSPSNGAVQPLSPSSPGASSQSGASSGSGSDAAAAQDAPSKKESTPKEGDVAVQLPTEVPQSVSEQAQAEAKQAEWEAAQTGFFRQNLARLRRNLCGPLHLGDAVWTAWILLWIIVTATTSSSVKYLWLFLFLLFYLWNLHWNWQSDECTYLRNCMERAAFEDYWKQLRATNPVVTLHTESWHWERRVSRSTTYHAGGGSTTTTTVRYVRVVSHREEETFHYRLCEDLSLDVEGSDLQKAKHGATFVHLWKEYLFGNMQTALAYASQFQALRSRNQDRDAHMDSFERMSLSGWRSRLCVYVAGERPVLLYFPIFALSCVLLLAWPMKLYMEWAADKGGFTMKKRLTQ